MDGHSLITRPKRAWPSHLLFFRLLPFPASSLDLAGSLVRQTAAVVAVAPAQFVQQVLEMGRKSRRFRAQVAEHVATGAMEKIGDHPQDFALRSFASSGCPE